MENEQESVSVHLELHPFDGDITLRQIAIGMQPLVLIEPSEDEEGNVEFTIVGSGLDQEELTGIMDLLAHVLKEGK